MHLKSTSIKVSRLQNWSIPAGPLVWPEGTQWWSQRLQPSAGAKKGTQNGYFSSVLKNNNFTYWHYVLTCRQSSRNPWKLIKCYINGNYLAATIVTQSKVSWKYVLIASCTQGPGPWATTVDAIELLKKGDCFVQNTPLVMYKTY